MLGISARIVLKQRQTDRIAELARRFVGFVKAGRARLSGWQQVVIGSK